MVIDGAVSWVGTENWSQGYFDGCRNVGLIVRLPDVANELGSIFDRVWTSQYASGV
jgi:hypothetical protein